jgi:hypothetical protein
MPRRDRGSRREILKNGLAALASVGGVVLSSRLAGAKQKTRANTKSDVAQDFFFLQVSDVHYGWAGHKAAELPLVASINVMHSMEIRPDFIVFTGDLAERADDDVTRRWRLKMVKEMTGVLPPSLYFLPGEHDTAGDGGAAYRDLFGPTHYSFDHKGVHFVALDNASDADGAVGAKQIDWLHGDLKKTSPATPVVAFAHRPLFDLHPDWGWSTKDGAKVIDVLHARPNVTVFYGHIHQEHHHQTGAIAHHAARSLAYALPAPGAAPKSDPLPWDSDKPGDGLGFRRVDEHAADGSLRLAELDSGARPDIKR